MCTVAYSEEIGQPPVVWTVVYNADSGLRPVVLTMAYSADIGQRPTCSVDSGLQCGQ